MSARKHPNTDRSHGGPGSSDQDERGVNMTHKSSAAPGQRKEGGDRNPHFSAISGGGGETDWHHAHSPGKNRRNTQA